MIRAFLVTAALAFAQPNPYAGKADAVRAGAKLYRHHCAACHGGDRQGLGRAPALRAASNAPDDALYRVLTNGILRHGMPSFSSLPPQQRWQIVTFLKSR